MSVLELLSQPLWQRLGLALVHFFWQGFALALLVAVIVRVARLRSNGRYLAYLLTLAVMIACPLVTFHLVDVGGPAAPAPAAETEAPVDSAADTGGPVVEASSDVDAAPLPATDFGVRHSVDWGERVSVWVYASLPWVLVVWMGGVAALSIRLLAGFLGLRRWQRQLEPLPDALKARVDGLAARLGLRGAWRVCVSSRVVEAMTLGWVRPMVLLPAAMVAKMPPEMLEAVIAHELAHIRRLDLWVNLLQRIVETLLFYHPAVWWVSHCLRTEREFCCDALAVRATGERLTYATTLESVARAQSLAPQPALAAGLARNRRPTLARVRHVLRLAPAPRNGSFWLAGLVVVVLLAGLLFATARAIENGDSGLADLERAVIQGIRANRAKFECGYLAWARLETRYDDTERNLSGEYELWWDGKKIATKYVHDVGHMTTAGQFMRIEKQQGGYNYDGGVLSKKPRYGSENWLAPAVSRWSSDGSLDWMILQSKELKNVARGWTVIDANNVELVRLTVTNTNKDDVDYNAYSIEDYDPAKGFGLVNRQWYNPDGSKRLEQTVRMAEVIPGGWFPVEIDTRSHTAADGHLRVRQRYALDLTRCRFNDRSALPKGIFTWTDNKQSEYQEKLQKYLAMELRSLSTVDEAAPDDAIKQGACEAIQAFLTAALAGDVEAAAGYAGRLPAEHIGELAEAARGQDLWIMAVLPDDASAIAVSSVIQGDHERIGPLVFTLNRTDADAGGKWLVNDIDLETPDTAEEELVRFLKAHPAAEKIILEEDAETSIAKPGAPADVPGTISADGRTFTSAFKLGVEIAVPIEEGKVNGRATITGRTIHFQKVGPEVHVDLRAAHLTDYHMEWQATLELLDSGGRPLAKRTKRKWGVIASDPPAVREMKIEMMPLTWAEVHEAATFRLSFERISPLEDALGRDLDSAPREVVHGFLTGPDGRPLTDALVRICERPQELRGGNTAHISPDSRGHYELGVPDVPYQVEAEVLLPEIDGGLKRYQGMTCRTIYTGAEQVDFQFDEFPTGTATCTVKVLDGAQEAVSKYHIIVIPQESVEETAADAGKGAYKRTFLLRKDVDNDDGPVTFRNVPAGLYKICVFPKDSHRYDDVMETDVVLAEGQTVTKMVSVKSKHAWYGRVLFHDGPPAVLPMPWGGARSGIYVRQKGSDMAAGIGEIAPDGYFVVHLADSEKASLDAGDSLLEVHLPDPNEENSYTIAGRFAAGLLAESREEAQVVYVDRPL